MFLFRKLTIAFGVVAVAGFGYFFYTGSVIRAFAWFLLCELMAQSMTKSKINKINRLRLNCEMNKYIASYEEILNKNQRANFFNRNGRQIVLLNLILGYLDIGNLDKAEQLLFGEASYIPEQTSPKTLNYRILYCRYVVTYYMERGDLEKAEQNLVTFRELVQKIPTDRPYQQGLQAHQGLKIDLELERGNLWEAEPYYTRLAEAKRPSRLTAVLTYMGLAKIYWWKQEQDNLEEAVRFVEENAGETWYGLKAKQLLETVPDRAPKLLSPESEEEMKKAELVAQLTEEDPPLLDPDEMEDPPLLDPEEMEATAETEEEPEEAGEDNADEEDQVEEKEALSADCSDTDREEKIIAE